MDQLPVTADLLQCTTGRTCIGTFVPLTRDLAKNAIDARWWNLPQVSEVVRRVEMDRHWQWRKLVGEHRNNLVWECVAIMTDDQEVQGAMVYRIDATSFLDSSLGTVYLDRLATAPRNRPWLVPVPAFKGVGSGLLLRAVCHSYMLGLGGRVSLCSLPAEQAKKFYDKLGFIRTAEDDDGMSDFELPADAAQGWLREEGLL